MVRLKLVSLWPVHSGSEITLFSGLSLNQSMLFPVEILIAGSTEDGNHTGRLERRLRLTERTGKILPTQRADLLEQSGTICFAQFLVCLFKEESTMGSSLLACA